MAGTNVRRTFDTRRLSEALKSQDIDLRHWVSYGTVGTIDRAGEFDPTDSRAIYNGPEGVEVDVLLEPLGLPALCKYPGMHGGPNVIIAAPIKPGDLVLVGLPDGGALLPPVILAVLNSATRRVPLDANRKPVFKNDRVIIHSNVPVEVHADKIRLGSDTSAEQLVLGTTFKAWMEDFFAALSRLTVPTAMGPSGTPINYALDFEPLKQRLDTLLSDTAYTEK